MRRALLPFLLALAACGEKSRPVKVAVAVPLSGDFAVDGRGLQRAAALAIEEAGPGVQLVSFDDGGEPARAAAVAAEIAADPDVVVVVGPHSSGCAMEAARVYAQHSLPMIAPSATAPALTAQQEETAWIGERVVFRLPPSDALQGDALARHALGRLGARSAAVLHDRTPYGLGLAEAFRDAYRERGGRVAFFGAVERGQRDFGEIVERATRAGARALFYGGSYLEAGPLLKQARAAGYRGAFLGGDGVKSDEFLALAGEAAHGAVMSVGGVPLESLPSAEDFKARYRARYGEEPRTYDHYGYEAARIAAAAALRVGRDRKKAIEWIRANHHPSMMGPFIFDAKGDSLKSIVTLLRVNGRVFEAAY